MNLNERETMEFKSFKAQVNILDKLEGESIRERYIEKFVNSTHSQYQEQIQKKYKFRDGYCYLGYLWDYMKEPTIIDEHYIRSKRKDIGDVYVFWDIHSCERILIKDYWKFGKRDIINLNFDVLIKGAMYLPEDIYIFDASYMWTMVMTHENINGKRYCIKCGNID
ncbi:MAG: DUF4275 family protein [Lachnospiraceae bacterium]|nr:DUF4275 family protein [Lachnospiraceae bacterium]